MFAIISDESDVEIQNQTERGLEFPDTFECPICVGYLQTDPDFSEHFARTDEEWGTEHHAAFALASVLVETTEQHGISELAAEVIEANRDWSEPGEEELRAATAVVVFMNAFRADEERYRALHDDMLELMESMDAYENAGDAEYEESLVREREGR
jgi:hypothetical protein